MAHVPRRAFRPLLASELPGQAPTGHCGIRIKTDHCCLAALTALTMDLVGWVGARQAEGLSSEAHASLATTEGGARGPHSTTAARLSRSDPPYKPDLFYNTLRSRFGKATRFD